MNPSTYRAYTLNGAALDAALADAPQERSAAARAGDTVTVSVPGPTGELIDFAVVDSPVMEPGLAAAHPDIQTYAGNSITAGYPASIRLDVTPAGFHAAVRSEGQASWFVDPAYQDDQSLYLSYFGNALPAPEKPFVEPELDTETQQAIASAGDDAGREAPDELVKQRVYRLALLTDPSYAEYVAPGLNDGTQDAASNAAVLAAKVTLMNRVNAIYNDDLAVRMLLIDGTDKLNLNTTAKASGANGPCGTASCFVATGNGSLAQGCTGALLTRQRYVIGLLAGASKFDIGHFMLGINGGGIASLGVVGATAKAQGCTGLPKPVGDFMAIDYVAHEMGHQFAGNHTFNGNTDNNSNCGPGNRNAGTSVEPGGGSSVMAYAGICGADDLQPHSDPYFSQRTQTEVSTYIASTPSTPNEVQEVALTGFDGTQTITLTYPTGTVSISSANYTLVGIAAAVQAVTGGTVTARGLYNSTTLTNTGFQLTFSGTLAAVDVPNPTATATGGVTALASDVVQGGTDSRGGNQVITTANHQPSVTAPAAKSVPTRTPFTLTGSATDLDSDSLIYLWEQNDSATTGIPLANNNKTAGPLFRQFGTYADVSATDTLLYNSPGENLATGNPSRTFPDLAQVVAGTTNAATGSCPAYTGTTAIPNGPILDCYSEFLPTAGYLGEAASGNALPPSLDFRLTARDMRANGGGSQYADVKLTIVPTAGPFQVTSQAAATAYAGNSSQTVTWDVNGTDAANLAPNVKITMSTDGGLTFPTVLAASTPNDGSQPITVPNVATTTARIRIEAVDNYFFDVNDAPITVTYVPEPLSVTSQIPATIDTRAGDTVAGTFSASTGFADGVSITATTSGLPGGLSLTRTAASGAGTQPGTASFALGGTVTSAAGTYPVTVVVSDGVTTQTLSFTIVVAAPPETLLVSQPPFLTSTSATFTFTSMTAGATFVCTLDDVARPCTSPYTVNGLSHTSHSFSVAATAAGVSDATPSTAVVTVPLDDRELKAKRGFKRKSLGGSYLGTVSQAKRKGAVLQTKVSGARALALVVDGKNKGKVRVFLGKKKLTTLKLKKTTTPTVVDIATFASPTSGKLRIVTKTRKPVSIDGLGVATS